MLKHHILIAWRNLTKNPFYTAVNIFGLASGLTITLLIGAYIWSNLQVNADLKDEANQYAIQSRWKQTDEGYALSTLGMLAKTLKEQYPSLVKNYYRFDGITTIISSGEKNFREEVAIGDTSLLDMYGFQLISGQSSSAFEGPFSVVITARIALKFFGKTDVAGQSLTIQSPSGDKHAFMITGVLKDYPMNSVTTIDGNDESQLFVSTDALSYFNRTMDWSNPYIVSYLELQKGVQPKDLDKPIQKLLKQHAAPQIAADLTPYLVPLSKFYLVMDNGAVLKMAYTLSGITLFILAMALINFVNISISSSARRMREIGVRKVLGGLRVQLIRQFLLESTFVVAFSVLVALLGYLLLRPSASDVLGKSLPFLGDFPLYFACIPLALVGMIGFIAGIYPALVLSALKASESLKGKGAAANEKVWFRKTLLAIQFGTATIVLTATFIVSKQIDLFFSKDLGYDKGFVVSAQVPRNWSPAGVQHMEATRQAFAGLPFVRDVTLSYEIPDGSNSGSTLLYKMGADSTSAMPTQLLYTDQHYAQTYGLSMAGGVFYGPSQEPKGVVINETQSRALGWTHPQDAVGQQVVLPQNKTTYLVAGVVLDFHFGSMQGKIPPITLIPVQWSVTYRYLSFKLKPGNVAQDMAALRKAWTQLIPDAPFDYVFMDDTIKGLYQSELQLQKAVLIATGLSIMIVLLGVLGLVSISIQKRQKEIGIRKVLGASIHSLINLFLKDFLPVVGLAGFIAAPLSFLLMRKWLDDYAYRVDITATPFVITLLLLGSLTAVLIIAQTFRTAMLNPVKSLRSE
jgi:putative ABC transport system permease protein